MVTDSGFNVTYKIKIIVVHILLIKYHLRVLLATVVMRPKTAKGPQCRPPNPLPNNIGLRTPWMDRKGPDIGPQTPWKGLKGSDIGL